MKWDSTRPVPWERLIKESALYGVVMFALLFFLFKEPISSTVPAVGIGMVFYVVFLAVLAKLGYERKTSAERRAEAQERANKKREEKGKSDRTSGEGRSTSDPGRRPKPAPTRRTNAASQSKRGGRRKR